MLGDALVSDRCQPDIESTVMTCVPPGQGHWAPHCLESELQVHHATVLAGCVSANCDALMHDRFSIFPTPDILGGDLSEHRTADCLAAAGWARKNFLKRMKVSAFSPPVYFGPRPINSPMMRMIHGPIRRQCFTAGAEERVDIITASHGVFQVSLRN